MPGLFGVTLFSAVKFTGKPEKNLSPVKTIVNSPYHAVMNKSLFETRYKRDILETQTRTFHEERRETIFSISNAATDAPDYSERGRFHLHKNTLLKSIFMFAENFRGFDHSEVIRDLLALKELCMKEEIPEKNTNA